MPYKDPKVRYEYFKKWKEINKDHVLSEAKKYNRKNRIKILKYARKYYFAHKQDPEYKKRMILKYKFDKIRNPLKHKARHYLRVAVREDRIKKPSICSRCLKRKKRIEGHHTDYSKMYDVIWLCVKCHRTVENRYNEY